MKKISILFTILCCLASIHLSIQNDEDCDEDVILNNFEEWKPCQSNDWLMKMQVINDQFVPPEEIPEADESNLIIKKNQQDDILAEMTDETSAICANINKIYQNIGCYIKYVNENPLSKYVPNTETFNGKTYQEYEREYLMYYKMIQKSE